MPTIPDLIRGAETRRKDAERRKSDADVRVKRMLSDAETRGEKTLSGADAAEADRLIEVVRSAKSEISTIDGELSSYRALQAEEDDLAKLNEQRTPTGVGRPPVTLSDGTRSGNGDADPARFVRLADGRDAALTRSQRFSDHEVVSGYVAARSRQDQAVIGQHGSLGNMLRAMTTTSGSAVVPTIWAGSIIDRARNMAAVTQAGAQYVPMDAKTVQIGRLTTDPTATFRTEGSTITASDPVFDNVTLTAQTMSALVVGSMEWFQDSNDVDQVVESAIAKAVALKLDEVSLFGGLTTGSEGFNLATPPNPRGVLATLLAVASSSVLGSGANGTAQTAGSFWNEVLDTIFTPRDNNEAPNALIWNSKLARQYAKAYDTTGQPLQAPPAVAELAKFVSNQIPSFTQGTMTSRATDLFAGDWSQLIIGQRLDFTVQTLTERYAENGQIGIVAHWRGDVALARPRAFSVYRYLQGA